MKRIIPAALILTFAMLACQLTEIPSLSPPEPGPAIQTVPSPKPVPANPIPLDGSLSSLYQQVIPGVVSIRTDTGQGSGFVYDDQGHIVTNQHVVEGASTVEVAFSSGYKAYGTVIGSDDDADIAVVKVDAPAGEFHPLPLGDSKTLQVGQIVVAIGNPFGLSGTMTLGIVSGLGRTQPASQAAGGGFFSTADIIQTDAAINPGNSGGPLFNLNGEVVGINQSIRTNNFNELTGNAVNSGVGFSISINLVKKIVPVLIRDGKYEYPYLGITSSSDLSLDEIEALGLTTYKGAYVIEVVPGGPADQAGIKAGDTPTRLQNLNAGGDLIVAFDGNPIATFDELLSYLITTKSPGDKVVLTVLRGGETIDITVTLGKRP
ncbi:MAG: trypsin-like peptidase domain-containing protein [Anaerolineales bacterium]|nr:trypsin-like peptidase domain-containing protein [Anaerolineales bacterium]NUQ84677.1 trypsin-like peptidase domain-containing protein [Anaerolineales bacterium]